MNVSPNCLICHSEETKNFLNRSGVPVHQNSLMKSSISARDISRGTLSLFVCEGCGFVFNHDFDHSKMNYNSEYNNSQTCSPFFDQYVDGLVQKISEFIGEKSCTVIEVGCGKGDFIKRIVQSNPNVIGYGFDPSYEGEANCEGGRLTIIKEFYDAEYAHIHADIVVCRHVIEHIEDPVQLLSAVRQTLSSSTNTKVFFETPCVEWILKNQVYWDFFYEHCSYFTKHSLTAAFERADFQVEQVTHIFNGQYLWIEATVGEAQPSNFETDAKGLYNLVEAFSRNENIVTSNWGKLIGRLKNEGGIAVWGAGAKGVTISHLLDPDCSLIGCIVDINPAKQGKYLPGTGHPIVSFDQLMDYDIRNVIVMNSNYMDEIRQLLVLNDLHINAIELSNDY